MKNSGQLTAALLISAIMIPSCKQAGRQDKSQTTMENKIIKREDYQTSWQGKQTDLFTLKNSKGMIVQVTNFGAKIVSIIVPDRKGSYDDVTFGYPDIDQAISGDGSFGAVMGRYANRIANGKLILDEKLYRLPVNNGPNTLHGGDSGFNNAVWDAERIDAGKGPAVRLTHLSVDGDQGFPGNLTATVTYTLSDENELIVDYHAVTDKKTVVNLTQHAYFNLAGHDAGEILDHVLVINADLFTPVNEHSIPTGELRLVEGTPLDFREPHAIGERIDSDYEQLIKGRGYDHNYVLNKGPDEMGFAASAWDRESGRFMEVFTTHPGIQLYTGNFLSGSKAGKDGAIYGKRNGFCLETQHFPDSPNRPEFPSTMLEPGEEYRHRTIFRFSVKED